MSRTVSDLCRTLGYNISDMASALEISEAVLMESDHRLMNQYPERVLEAAISMERSASIPCVPTQERQPLGVASFDELCDGFPFGEISMIYGPDSCRVEMAHQVYQHAVSHGKNAVLGALYQKDSYDHILKLGMLGVQVLVWVDPKGMVNKRLAQLIRHTGMAVIVIKPEVVSVFENGDNQAAPLGSISWQFFSSLTLRASLLSDGRGQCEFKKVRSAKAAGKTVVFDRLTDDTWISGVQKIA